jgi:hypothetical protein
MTPEQLNWTDEQWAIHMGCPVQDVPSIRTYVRANFFPVIEQDKESGEYNFAVTRMGTSMSGTRRVVPMVSDKKVFSDVESARTHANNEVIPKLELSKFWSNALYIPQRALQMLHVQER